MLFNDANRGASRACRDPAGPKPQSGFVLLASQFPQAAIANMSWALVSVGFALVLLATGCSQEVPPPPPALAPAEAPTAFKQAFDQAKPEVQKDASQLADSLAAGKFTDAFVKIGSLSSRPELSPAQRETVGRAQVTVMEKLREAAARGDPQAMSLLELHSARK